MAGPYPPYRGPDPYLGQPLAYPENYGWYPPAASYPISPASLPQPDRHRRVRLTAALLLTLAVVAGMLTAAVFATRNGTAGHSAILTAGNAQRAIQNYLDALSDGDIQTIARNSLCGLYDGVRDRRTDDALARLSSEAFQTQFSKADVTSVDTMVFASPTSAQALFTMRVVPAPGARGEGGAERQAVAQLLAHNNEIVVCSYVQRTAATF